MGYCTNCCCVYILFFRKIRFPCYTGDFQFYVIKPSITQKQINEIALFQYKLVNNTTDLIHIQIWLNWELLICLAPCHTLVPSSGEQACSMSYHKATVKFSPNPIISFSITLGISMKKFNYVAKPCERLHMKENAIWWKVHFKLSKLDYKFLRYGL